MTGQFFPAIKIFVILNVIPIYFPLQETKITLFVIWILERVCGLIFPVKVYILSSRGRGKIYMQPLKGNMRPYTLSRIHVTNMYYCRAINVEIEQGFRAEIENFGG
jgi:hypothetical protein